ncbi:hypothetical protein [Pseudomonas benzenivorans]|uniref:Uncharacterized protein n=1 Tax=Pseudomonas benzenivorans TaxID=556533 RepID=A0ABY5HA89_9PSED|nr:hypothetical protein [Pseudomonas benzenivorans]UTW09190.1 hypothetical protein KDW96_07755 [Pseudomonas benzenivorans]
MRIRWKQRFASLLAIWLWGAVAGPVSAEQALTERAYAEARATMGVVLLGVSWGRAWGYCGFENVQLRSLGFDHMPVRKHGDSPSADIELEGPGLTAKPISQDYALLLAPGEYALTAFHIKAAKSVNDVGAFQARRSQLLENGAPLAGSFTVAANEVVYVGHFAPECPQVGQPTIWRYYLRDAAALEEYLAKVKGAHPYLDVGAARFRLFKTSSIGEAFQLP